MNEHTHVQDFQVRRAPGEATAGNAGERIIEGKTGAVHTKDNIRTYVGAASDLFAGDAFALHASLSSFIRSIALTRTLFCTGRTAFPDAS